MNQIQAMRVFVRVAESRSFRRAARQFEVSNAFVTRCIAMLESHLNTRLINRTTRNLSLTEAGLRYLEGCRSMLEELDQLDATVASAEHGPSGTLRVAVSAALSPLWVTPLIDGFRRRYPSVKIRLTLAEHQADLAGDSFDVGIVTAFRPHDDAFVEHPLGVHALVACASPAYLAQHGNPATPRELSRHAFVALPADQHEPTWRLKDRDAHVHEVMLPPVYTVNSAPMVRLAALAGMGIAILPIPFVADDFAAGDLKRIMEEYEIDAPEAKVSIVYPERQFLPAKTRSFIDFTLEHFGHGEAVDPQRASTARMAAPFQQMSGVPS
ncbi:LysR family transcriptional regulator [Trinickia terrae]|uniref:LysR family transcriptional regulator n=1 Tax=Trinickia terrae TaxID=2571161 RepID=A0A4V5PL90_9BURK|nr:LysR family transcriptional regulator [Trinickia terrae]TKC91140.1 LysR family transcriptional regulator [Trinickia terrae]